MTSLCTMSEIFETRDIRMSRDLRMRTYRIGEKRQRVVVDLDGFLSLPFCNNEEQSANCTGAADHYENLSLPVALCVLVSECFVGLKLIRLRSVIASMTRPVILGSVLAKRTRKVGPRLQFPRLCEADVCFCATRLRHFGLTKPNVKYEIMTHESKVFFYLYQNVQDSQKSIAKCKDSRPHHLQTF